MAKVLKNQRISDKVFVLFVEGLTAPKQPGQFYMLRPNGATAPFLPRPISVFDYRDNCIEFLVEIQKEGTELLSKLSCGDEIEVFGPFGNGFSFDNSQVALIGGGTGCAPLLYFAKEIRKQNENINISVYLGFNQKDDVFNFLVNKFNDVANSVVVNIGGFITDDIIYDKNVVYYACGRDGMLKALQKTANNQGVKMYLDYGKRMACGVGACRCCVAKTTEGNKRTCKEGPVFLSTEIIID